jgi:DNA-3-methyladenine glycosylase II
MLHAAPLSLTPRPPFDFAQTLEYLRGFRADGLGEKVVGDSLEVPLLLDGAAVLARLRSVGTPARPALEGEVLSAERLSERALEHLRTRLAFYLSLDDDLTPFYEAAARDPAMRPVVTRLHGFHPPKFPSLFACVVWALVTQRTPNRFAFSSMERIVASLGPGLEGQQRHAFPPPQRFLLPDAPALLLAATNNTRKTERLVPLARAFLGLDEDALRRLPYDEAAQAIGGLPGIGPWSTEYALLRGLGRTERTHWTDTWLLGGLSRRYAGGWSISRGDARVLAEPYGWHQGLWVAYLKRYDALEEPPAQM